MVNDTHDYGDLRVTLTYNYTWDWDDRGSKGSNDVTFYTANSEGNLSPLGSVGIGNYTGIEGKRATLLVGENPNRSPGKDSPVARPLEYMQVWNDKVSGSHHDGSLWRPVAPPGYIGMGDVSVSGYDAPDTRRVWCLRKDLTLPSSYRYDAPRLKLFSSPIGFAHFCFEKFLNW